MSATCNIESATRNTRGNATLLFSAYSCVRWRYILSTADARVQHLRCTSLGQARARISLRHVVKQSKGRRRSESAMAGVRFVAMHGYVVAPSGSSGQHLAELVWAVQVYKNDIQAARAALESGVDVNAQDQESSWYAYFSSVHASHQHEPCLRSAPVRKEQNPSNGIHAVHHPRDADSSTYGAGQPSTRHCTGATSTLLPLCCFMVPRHIFWTTRYAVNCTPVYQYLCCLCSRSHVRWYLCVCAGPE